MEEQKAAREKARAEEIKAISEAVTILNDDDALETFSKAKGGAFVQKPRRVTYDAFIQLTSHRHSARINLIQRNAAMPVKQDKNWKMAGTADGTHEHPDEAE